MKKIISAILLVALMLSLTLGTLTGCKKTVTAPEFAMPEGGFDTSKPVEITFYHQMGSALQGILDKAIEDFQKVYPNITIVHKSQGDYDGIKNQIKTEITVGDQPNIAYCYPDHVALYNMAGAVQSLDSLIGETSTITRPYFQSEIDAMTFANENADEANKLSAEELEAKIAAGVTEVYGFTTEQKNNFIEAYYNEGLAYGDGKMYTLPISKSTEVMYYNKTFFEKHGLKVPTTWEEMAQVCEQIKAIDASSIPLGYDSESNWFITMCEQYGSPYTSIDGDKFLFDNETNRGFVKMFRDWFQKKWVTTEQLNGGAYTSALFTGKSSSGDKVTTRCYMCIGSTGGATYQQPTQTNGQYEFEVGIATIPQVNPEQPKVISQGPSICVFKDEDPQKVLASWLFVKFLTTDVNFQARVSMNNGYAPVIKSVEQNPVYADFLNAVEENATANIQAYAVKVALDQAKAYYVSPAFNGSSAAREQVGLLMQKCLSGETADVDAFIKKAFEEAVAECKYQAGM